MDIKPGYKSMEVWNSIVATAVALLVMAGVIEPARQNEVTELIVQAVGGVVALGSVLGLLLARTELKKTQMQLKQAEPVETKIQG